MGRGGILTVVFANAAALALILRLFPPLAGEPRRDLLDGHCKEQIQATGEVRAWDRRALKSGLGSLGNAIKGQIWAASEFPAAVSHSGAAL